MISPNYLLELTQYTHAKLAKVVLNRSHEITTFANKELRDGKVYVEYVVPKELGTEISLIEIKDSQNNVISANSVFVPLQADTLIRQIVTIREVQG